MPRFAEPSRAVACELIADALRAGHSVTIRAQGTSMVPAIWPGDRLTIRPINEAVPAIGEVALTLWEGGLRAHRVIGRIADSVITQGDALGSADAATAHSEILGTIALRNGKPMKNRRNFLDAILSGAVTSLRPLQSIALKLIALRRRFERARNLEPLGA
ncbi:MAG TPA: S24/S26 family peptidase [Candidatus Binataceae bacterium]|nr:S24/S26 family peptidase [Candidatus Binataceae bacterium]